MSKLGNKTVPFERKAIGAIPLQKLFPNMITLLALCLGATSVRYALDLKMEIAAALIVISAFLDGIDGRVARLLNASSDFGAHLDSIADMVNFGIAPVLVTYIWILHDIPYKGIGWAVVLLYVTCSALRLARFNTQLEDEEALAKSSKYFTGIPMPAAALLCLLPMISTFQLLKGEDYNIWFVSLYVVIIAVLMVSRVPTFSGKKVTIKKGYVSMLLTVVAVFIALLLLEPWIFLPVIGVLYLSSIPASIYCYWFKKL